jgi:hypothetical protein
MSGLYQRVCEYFAYLYRYDWYISAEVNDDSVSEEKILKDYAKILSYFDKSYIKKLCGDIALETIVNGVYYGYINDCDDHLSIQTLPAKYCRSRYSVG